MPVGTDPAEAGADTPLFDQLVARRAALLDEVEPMIMAREEARSAFETRSAAEDETAQPTDEERTAYDVAERDFNASVAAKQKEVVSLNLRIDQQELIESRRETAASASRREGRIERQREPATYREDNKNSHSYFLDLAMHMSPEARARGGAKSDGYMERLEKHSKEVADWLPERQQARQRRADEAVDRAEREIRGTIVGMQRRGLDSSPFEREVRAPNRIVGSGGYAIPPLWLIDQYIPYLRPGRVAAGLCRQMVLPEGTDSINIPRLTTPTRTAIQAADNAPVASQDIADSYQQANVKTIAGQEDVPIQLIEQSPGHILDDVLMTDLTADYNQQVDLQVIKGNGTGAPLSGGQVVGIYPSTNWTSTGVTWTAASPTGNGFFQVLGVMASKVAQNRFNLQDFTYLVHPRRWFWAATATDGATAGIGRPIVSSNSFPHFNTFAEEADPTPFEGLAGRVPFGPRVYIDANVPIVDASGGTANEDVAIGALWDDLWLFEGDLRTRVLTEVLSGTLELRFQVYGYIAFLQRYGVSVALATGTGLAPPSTMDTVLY